jgi:uncharacterized membrane protein YkgB
VTTHPSRISIERIATKLATIDTIGAILSRYGLVVVIGWIGALKFANFEAHQISPLVANSPFMGWLYGFLSEYTFSALLGVVELTAAVLLAIKPIAPKLSIGGSVLSIVLFVSTISFLFTTPGVGEPLGGGFPRPVTDRRIPAQGHPAARAVLLDPRRRHQSHPTQSPHHQQQLSRRLRRRFVPGEPEVPGVRRAIRAWARWTHRSSTTPQTTA